MKRLMMLFGMLAVLAFIGCDDKFTGGQSGLTEHVVRLAVSCDAFQEKSILPSGQTLAIASYDIAGTGPEGASFSLDGQAENEHHSFNLGYLAIGSWHLSAVARNAEGSAIARGETDVFLSRKSTNATLVLDSLVGKGNLEVHVSWAKDQVKQEDCTLIAKLKDQKGNDVAITPSLGKGSATIVHDSLASGSYVLTLELLSENIHVSGATTAIRIVDGALSRGTIELKIGDRSQSFALVIHNDTSLPIQATVTCNPEEVTASTPQVTLTAKATNLAALGLSEEALSYQWYHEGTLIEEADTSSLTLTDKKLGSHRYDVVITSAKPGSIGSVTVTVTYPAS